MNQQQQLNESKKKIQFKLVKTLKVDRSQIITYELNNSGNILVTGSGNECKVWNTINGKIIVSLQEQEENEYVHCIEFNYSHGDHIITKLRTKSPKIWNIATRKVQPLVGYCSGVNCIAFDPHSQFIATGLMDSTAKLWDIQTGQQAQIYIGHQKDVVCLHFKSSGDQLLTGSRNCIQILIGHTRRISCTQYNFSGIYCATGSYDRTCKIWDTKTGNCLQTLKGHEQEISGLCFNKTGLILITGSFDYSGRVYNVQTGECLQILSGYQGGIVVVQYLKANNSIISLCTDNSARIHSEAGECLQVFQFRKQLIPHITVNYEGNIIITQSRGGKCKVWKLKHK